MSPYIIEITRVPLPAAWQPFESLTPESPETTLNVYPILPIPMSMFWARNTYFSYINQCGLCISQPYPNVSINHTFHVSILPIWEAIPGLSGPTGQNPMLLDPHNLTLVRSGVGIVFFLVIPEADNQQDLATLVTFIPITLHYSAREGLELLGTTFSQETRIVFESSWPKSVIFVVLSSSTDAYIECRKLT